MTAREPAATATEPEWVAGVLDFWFVQSGPRDWFARDDAFDARLRERFGELHARLAADPGPLPDTARVALATVIVLDQFSRNLHRGDARAFAADAAARAIAAHAIERGFDRGLDAGARLFLYLPFEHSEDLADQDRAVALVAALGNAEWSRYAEAHRAVVARFGRFPHRNATLGRAPRADEIAAGDVVPW